MNEKTLDPVFELRLGEPIPPGPPGDRLIPLKKNQRHYFRYLKKEPSETYEVDCEAVAGGSLVIITDTLTRRLGAKTPLSEKDRIDRAKEIRAILNKHDGRQIMIHGLDC